MHAEWKNKVAKTIRYQEVKFFYIILKGYGFPRKADSRSVGSEINFFIKPENWRKTNVFNDIDYVKSVLVCWQNECNSRS